ncbi:hypothetical protein I6L87_00420 [Streptococcus mutans]|nr:hypothetical protein [Streptococcus mutans]
MTMSTSQMISVLSAIVFLLKVRLLFKISPEIVLFNFYGRIYYKLNNNAPIKERGRLVIEKLPRHPQAIKLGKSRTCLPFSRKSRGYNI